MIMLKLAMDMPKGCRCECPFYWGAGNSWTCSAIPGDKPHIQTWQNVERYDKERLVNCPLVEVEE